ncbi:MAG: FAD-linked oxidase C-terminal domain-containing protein [Phycisphaerae bacterium]
MPETSTITPDDVACALDGRVRGDVLTDRFSRAAYATAACIYRIPPLAVVVPKSAEDVAAAVEAAGRLGIPVTARGAGSGVVGQALGRGIVLDFTKYMDRVLDIDTGARLVRVQPGAVTEEVNSRLAPHGLMLGPDPSSAPFCTVGGNLGTNASGARGIRYGSMREHVAWLDVVLADGSRARLEPVGADGEGWQALADRDDLLGRAAAGTRRLVEANADLLRAHRPYTSKHSAGYNLFNVLDGGRVDLTRLIVGSEGTLAIVVEAAVRAVPKPSERASLLLWFDCLEKGGEAIHSILDLGPSACEIMERVFLDIVRADGSVPEQYLPPEADTVVLVEQLSDSRAENEAFIRRVRETVIDDLGLAFGGLEAYDPAEQERLWQVRKQAVQILQRLPGPKRITPFIEDVSVPPDRLVEYIHGIREVFDRHGVEAAIYGHAGDSNLHARPILDTRRPEDVARMRAIADDVAALVVRLGGTVSCEHGDGLARSGYLRLQFGEDLYALMQEVKRLWDPGGILNPGKVVTDERHVHTDDLRVGPGFALAATGEAFDRDPWAEELVRCHGCGTCREFCPVFKVTGDEAATPRGKANLLREILSGGLDPADLDAERMRHVAGLCYNCKSCLVECPSRVNVPGLLLKHKQHLAARGHLPWTERQMTRVRPMGRAGSAAAPVSNWMLGRPSVRWLMEKVGGIGRRAAMPPFSRDRLPEGVRTPADGEPVRRVAYFAGCFELFNEPQIGRAALRVLQALGCEVFIPEQRCCGIPKICAGDARAALADRAFNLDVLAPLVEAGFVVASGCPSCVLTLTEEWLEMDEPDERTAAIAEATRDVHDLLEELADERDGPVPTAADSPWRTRRLAYHAPCHLRAAGRGEQPKRLLERLLGLEFVLTNEECCGMGGTYGLKAANAETSEAIARPVMDRIRDSGAEAVVTSCGMCRTQLAHGTGLPVVHPMEVLADALAPASHARP